METMLGHRLENFITNQLVGEEEGWKRVENDMSLRLISHVYLGDVSRLDRS